MKDWVSEMCEHGHRAAIIGTVTTQHIGMLAAKTAIGGTRIIPH